MSQYLFLQIKFYCAKNPTRNKKAATAKLVSSTVARNVHRLSAGYRMTVTALRKMLGAYR